MTSSRLKWLLLLFVAISCFFGSSNLQANILTALPEFGDLGRWGAFSLGGGISETDVVDQFTGTTDIYGDVGVAGDGNVTLSGSATIHGDLYYKSTGTLTLNGNARITGNKHHDAASDTILNNDVTRANNTSTHAASFTSSFAYAGLTNITSSMTLTANPNPLANGATVLNLNSIVLGNYATLTLVGTTADNFVLNVSNQFSLTAQSKIVLTGGLSWDDVLFNIKGTGTDVTIDGQSSMSGILMANKRTVSLSGGSLVSGEVISNKLKLSGSSRIINPSVASP